MDQITELETDSGGVYMPDHMIELEPSPRWVRVKFNDVYLANSKSVLLSREAGRLPIYYFPKRDVRMELLQQGRKSQSGDRKQYWNVRVGDREEEAAAWSYVPSDGKHTALEDHIAFRWNKMDAWFEEEEEVFVHPRDPYKRVDTLPSSRHIKVEINGVIVAESRRPHLLFETGLPVRYYLPPEDVHMEMLNPTSASTRCPYKGVASYWSVTVGEQELRNIVWSYQDPIPECPKITGLLCFYNEKVDLYVDGELQPRPVTPWS